jgi:hypothetical protein
MASDLATWVASLRTQLLRIIRKAGVQPWEKPWRNLRSTREAELANSYPLHVVTAWLGNTPQVADRHYLQITAEHYAQAVAEVVQQVVQHPPETACNDLQPLSERPQKTRGKATFPTFPEAFRHAQEDSNLRPAD